MLLKKRLWQQVVALVIILVKTCPINSFIHVNKFKRPCKSWADQRNFIRNTIEQDLQEKLDKVITRFPPEPNGSPQLFSPTYHFL
jgi:hypothetical protein